MTAQRSGFFTLKEINRLKIIQDIIDGRMKISRAAEHQDSAAALLHVTVKTVRWV